MLETFNDLWLIQSLNLTDVSCSVLMQQANSYTTKWLPKVRKKEPPPTVLTEQWKRQPTGSTPAAEILQLIKQADDDGHPYLSVYVSDPGVITPHSVVKVDLKMGAIVDHFDISARELSFNSKKGLHFQKMEDFRNKQMLTDVDGVQKSVRAVEANLPCVKKCGTLAELQTAVRCHLLTASQRMQYYSQRKILRLRLDAYIAKQRAMQKWVAAKFGQSKQLILVGCASMGRSKYRQASTSGSAGQLRKIMQQRGHKVILISEYLSSQCCNSCDPPGRPNCEKRSLKLGKKWQPKSTKKKTQILNAKQRNLQTKIKSNNISTSTTSTTTNRFAVLADLNNDGSSSSSLHHHYLNHHHHPPRATTTSTRSC
jgi:hypothetical protein